LALLVGPLAAERWAVVVEDVGEEAGEEPEEAATLVVVRGDPAAVPAAPVVLPEYDPDDPSTHYRLLAQPQQQLHSFAWTADSAHFPPAAVQAALDYTELDPAMETVGTTAHGYFDLHDALDVYLAEAAAEPALDTWVLSATGGGLRPLWVAAEELRPVTLKRGEIVGVPEPLFNQDGTPQLDGDGKLMTATRNERRETQISATATTWRLQDLAGLDVQRSDIDFPATFHTGFERELRLADRAPNPAAATMPLEFAADLRELRPGRPLVLAGRDGKRTQVVEVRQVVPLAADRSELHWNELTPPPAEPFRFSELRLNANVAPLAHGKTVEQILGGSDGVTPFLRFALKQAPVTLLPGAGGGEPAVEVRVGGVEWRRVGDFYASAPTDRHYRLEVDEEQVTAVLFGDGRKGAIPPSGKKHITASYKVGLGGGGNVAAGGVSRIKRAHPLVESAVNPA
ncbi:MAG: hypothetical protein ACRD2T_15135, partial [Thermoanaerobaculia bacterium]